VVQAADFWNLHNLARGGKRDRPEVGCVLVKREVGARLIVIGDVPGQDMAQVSFAQDEHVVETLAPDGTDQALGERILPGAVRRREDFGDPHALDAVAELLAIHPVTVAQEVGGRRVAGNAATICCAVQTAVGCSVTLKWTTRRRWWASTTRTNRTRKRAVGTVKKSMETKSRTWLARNVRQV
jgi:hypothetical protein